MATISSLSDDILYLIFLHTLPSIIDTVSGWPDLRFTVISPLDISPVCRSWHRIVESRPSLWASIHFLVYHRFQGSLPDIPQVLTRFLQKSASSSLDISLSIKGHVEDCTGLTRLLEVISGQMHRIRAIDIKVIDWSSSQNTSSIPFKCTPASASIAVWYTYRLSTSDPDRPSSSPVLLDLSSCTGDAVGSRLHTLGLDSSVPWRLPSSTDDAGALSLPTLENLELGVDNRNRRLNDVLVILSACPNLKTLKVLDDTGGRASGIDTNRILMPYISSRVVLHRLRSLHLSAGDLDVVCFFGRLTCPDLYLLQVHGRNPFTTDMLGALTELIKRSEARVEILHLKSWFHQTTPLAPPYACARALEALLEVLDELSELDLEGWFVADERLIEALTVPHDDVFDPICPKLTRLRLICNDGSLSEACPEVIEGMIESRWRCSDERKLRSVDIRLPGFLSDPLKASERMRECIEEGLIFR